MTKKKKTADTNLTCRYQPGLDGAFQSVWTQALNGNTEALQALGIASLSRHDFPVAFETTRWWIDEQTKIVRAVLLPQLKPHDPEFDVRKFFRDLLGNHRFPLDTESDLLRYLMALAAPLLRLLAPGLIGAFWFVGPPGSGKEYLKMLLGRIYLRALVHPPVHAIAEMQVKDDLQLERSFYDNRSVIYVSSTEIAKRIKLIDPFIRFTAAPEIAIKGLNRAEQHISNRFTFLADSAEAFPSRQEVERRTTLLKVKKLGDEAVLGEIADEVLSKAPSIIAALLRLIESKPRDWYLNQAALRGRPLIQVALARLFEVDLDEVRGRDMTDVFEAMEKYVRTGAAQDEGTEQKGKCRDNDGDGATKLSNYRYTHFHEVMTRSFDEQGARCDPQGFQDLFSEFRTVNSLRVVLDREMDYTKVGRGKQPYLPVVVGDKHYAFKFVRSGRNFIFTDEALFCRTTEITALTPEVRAQMESEDAAAKAEPASEPDTPAPVEPEFPSFEDAPND